MLLLLLLALLALGVLCFDLTFFGGEAQSQQAEHAAEKGRGGRAGHPQTQRHSEYNIVVEYIIIWLYYSIIVNVVFIF